MSSRLLANAFAYVQVGNYKKASELWEQVVSLDGSNPFAHGGLAGVAHQNRHAKAASSHYKAALAGLSKANSSGSNVIGPAVDEGHGGGGGGGQQAGGFHPGDPYAGHSCDQRILALLHSLGDSMHSAGHFKQAIDVFHDALDFVEPGSGGDKRRTDVVLPCRAAAIGSGEPLPCPAKAGGGTVAGGGGCDSDPFPADKATSASALSVAKSLLHVKMGKAFYAQDGAAEKDAGITLIQAVLKEQGEEYAPALVAYAVCLAERGHEQEALRVYLRLLVKDSGNKGVQVSST
jgi:tetratricopeptide (TPR) repeat protein